MNMLKYDTFFIIFMFKGVTLYSCQDLPGRATLRDLIINGEIPNNIIDKNTQRNRNLPSILRDVTSRQNRIIGVVDYFFQDRASSNSRYQDVHSTSAFILSPTDNILAVLGKGTDAHPTKNLLSQIIDGTQNDVQYFTNLEIAPEPMLRIARRVRDSREDNWCERPRFSHEAERYHGHVYNDYADGDFNCIFDTAQFIDEFPNSTGFSPIIKYHSCDMLDPHADNRPKTMRFKHEGQISTSQPYNFENWDRFIFELVVPLLRGN